MLYWTKTNATSWAFRSHTFTMAVGTGGIPGPPGPEGPQGPIPAGHLAVFDEDGTRVGPVVGFMNRPPTSGAIFNRGVYFTLKVGDITVLLAQLELEGELWGTQFDGLQFESTNCTGQPVFDTTQINNADLMRMVQAVVGGPAPGQAGGGGDNIVYIADPNGTPRIANLGSHPSDGAKSATCTLGASPGIEVIDAIQLIDLDAVFTRPFHVQEDVAP